MANNLYFIPLLAWALEQDDAQLALQQAFKQIRQLGRRKAYRTGYAQFRQFIATALEGSTSLREERGNIPEEIIARYIADIDEESAWNAPFVFILELKGEASRTTSLQPPALRTHFRDIAPGVYTLKLETGWTIWNDALSERHLLWHEAYADRTLQLAADTEQIRLLPTYETIVLGGELTIRAFPGIERGHLEIERRTL